MRRMIVAALAVGVLLTAGCQDQEARTQNARLQAELDLLKTQQNKGGSNDAFAQWLAAQSATKGNDDLEKRVNSLSEDIGAGLDDIKKQIKDSNDSQEKRVDDLEDQLKKVSDIEGTISALKGMIESLETKVKNVDPNEVLTAKGDLLARENDLRLEKQAREDAEKRIADLQQQLADAKAEVENIKAELVGLEGEDISKHPDYKKLSAEKRKLESEVKNLKSDYENLKIQKDALEEQLRKGANPPGDTVTEMPKNYEFSGTVAEVSKGARPDGPSYLLVGSIQFKTEVPAVGTELMVVDAKNQPVCKVKVIRHYHFDDREEMPVDEVGCQTLDENAARPVAKGDSVIWIKPDKEDGGDTSNDAGTRNTSGGNDGTAGGD
ncbi:MAG: hypothetical protein KDB32_07965 [Planctomycetes bacterium]|nr:hypothetical protein [Planctomycetota bacterium]MCA8946343.1 hypothetical protein [Planctomycetota bacterium]